MCTGATFKDHKFEWATGLFSPEWIKDHKKELLAAAAVVGAAYTGGASLGLLGGAGAGAAAGGAAAGEGLLAAEAGLGAAELGAGASASAGGLGAAELGAGASSGLLASDAYATAAGGEAATPFMSQTMLNGFGTGLDRFGRIAQFAQRSGLGQTPQRTPMAPPMGVQPLQTQSGIPSLAQTYPTNVVDEERKRRLLMMRGGYV